jgi:hypothetical protein
MKKFFWLLVFGGIIIFLLITSMACEASTKEGKSVSGITENGTQEEATAKEDSEIKVQPIGWIYCFDNQGELILISMVSQYQLKSEGNLTYIWWKNEKDTELMWTDEWLYSQQVLRVDSLKKLYQ